MGSRPKKNCRVECVRWPNGRGMTAIVKSWQADEQALKMAYAEGLLYISLWPNRRFVHLNLETAGLRFTREGSGTAAQVLLEEAKRLDS